MMDWVVVHWEGGGRDLANEGAGKWEKEGVWEWGEGGTAADAEARLESLIEELK